MANEFINADGNGITDAFVKYALPLTGGLPRTQYLGNFPKV
jgi:ATP-dependent phosphofructokinase / diphosphate-dependent phosphofructokinase